jgi:hypothetical protein
MRTTILTILFCVGAVSLNAQQPIRPSDPSQGRVEGALYQNVFATAIQAPLAEKAYGEPAIAWHNGEYFLIYDTFGAANGPACLMTSKDGVYWREEGAILYPDADHDDGCIECPDLRQFAPGGPFVLSYDAKLKGTQHHVRRFAVSDDLRHWKKLPGTEFGADERFYKKSPFYNQYSIRNPDGGWFAVLNAAPRDFMGLGLATSMDGLKWECLPPLRVTGVADQQFGKAGPSCKAVETSGIMKLGDRHFITGGNPLANADIILAARDITGPYEPAQKNAIHLRIPQIFQRVYDLPGGYLSMPIVWANRDRRYYHVAPFRSVATDGESLWFKWWAGNDKLKVHPLPATLPTDAAPGGLRMLQETFDVAKGLVLEAKVALPVDGMTRTNWAATATATASATHARAWWPDGHFAAEKAVDDKSTTAWRAPGEPEQKGPVTFRLDLGAVRPIGSVQIVWLAQPAKVTMQSSLDGTIWSAPRAVPKGNSVTLENLAASARFLTLECTPGRTGVGIAEIVVSPDPVWRLPEAAGGLFIEYEPGKGWAWFIERSGRVRFGDVVGNRFQQRKERDLEVEFADRADLRIVLRGDLVDLYVNDYQVDYYQLPGVTLSGRIGLYSPTDAAAKAWRPDPHGEKESPTTKGAK